MCSAAGFKATGEHRLNRTATVQLSICRTRTASTCQPDSSACTCLAIHTPGHTLHASSTACCCTPLTPFHTGAYAGLRASGKKADLALVVCDTDAVVGGTFTQNVMCAAPVLYCQDVLSRYAFELGACPVRGAAVVTKRVGG